MIKNNNEIRFAEGIMHEDNIFLIRTLYHSNKFVTVPGLYYYWRRYPTSVSMISSDSDKYRNDAFIAFNQILDSLDKMSLPVKDKSAVVKKVLSLAKQRYVNESKTNYLKNKIKKVTEEYIE